MFKHLILYRIGGDMPGSAEGLCEILAQSAFVATGPTQKQSTGWVPPRGDDHGPFVQVIDGHWVVKLQTETRLLPNSVIEDRLEELADHVEKGTGRRPGKKARRDLKEQAIHELLPKAFTKRTSMLAWIDTEARILAVDAGSQGRADEFVSMFVQHASTGRMNLALMQSKESPAACMAAWLLDGDMPEGFAIDSDCELKGMDERKPVVKYARHPLDIDEVKAHLTSGKMPTKMGMSYAERVAFELNEAGHIRRLSFLDLAFEGRPEVAADEQFDADVALATGELRKLIASLMHALGGEYVPPIEEAAASPATPTGDEPDPLYDQAVAVVLQHKKASISLVQRHLRIGYNRAARLLETMERTGLVSPMAADGQRQITEGEHA
ncbi:MAG TPA: recombination-associated protein RdgC [Roseateles sp.]|uniref:recombination-associated protein RdgC n=1 Tax=Roseateles sp. TaxID=1971397 RepID=UPI002EDAB7F3